MDLLQETNNKNRKKETQSQKIILILLITSILLSIITALLMAFVYTQEGKTAYSITINGKNIDTKELKLISNKNGEKYISLKALSMKLGYDYFNGEYKIADEGKSKGYIYNKKNIVQFFADSKEIYKTTYTTETDYEYYMLEKPIIEYEGSIYIYINDLGLALNLIVNHVEKTRQTKIQTPEYWVEQRVERFKQNNIVISNTPENLRALSYGFVIISKDNNFGVISLDGNEVIGNKYSSISFCEYKKNFIVSSRYNKYGVISKAGIAEIDLQYDSLKIINYNPLLYKVERLEKFGVLNNKGEVINEIKYSSIGYPANNAKEINYTLLIPNLNENIPQSIVVCQDNKYGLISVETGKEIVTCILNGIYTKADDKTAFYAEMSNEKLYSLQTLVENLYKLTGTVE